MEPDQIITLTNGFYLLFLAVAGNFIGSTLGCETQYHFINNVYLKQFIIFLLLYFTINFSSNNHPHVNESLLKTAILWLFFLLFARMPVMFTYIVLLLMFVLLIFENHKKYLVHNPDNKHIDNVIEITNLIKIQKTVVILIIGLVLIGFLKYYYSKRENYTGNFRIFKFMTDASKCDIFKKTKHK